jgi:hypothetical protein
MNFILAITLAVLQVVDVGGGKIKRRVLIGTDEGYMICYCYANNCEVCTSYNGDGQVIGKITLCPSDPECS